MRRPRGDGWEADLVCGLDKNRGVVVTRAGELLRAGVDAGNVDRDTGSGPRGRVLRRRYCLVAKEKRKTRGNSKGEVSDRVSE